MNRTNQSTSERSPDLGHDQEGSPVTHQSRRKFDNQYNNAQYLVHPEKTYTQKILNLIFEPKTHKVNRAPKKVEEAEPVQQKAAPEKSSPQKSSAATKTNSKTNQSPQKPAATRKGK